MLLALFGFAALVNLAWVFFFLWNHLYLRVQDRNLPEPANWPSVDILIPARNEARNIERCVRTLAAQDYPGDWHLTVCDDESTDDTLAILQRLQAEFPHRLTVLVGAAHPLPPGWCGKCWATARMGEAATRDWLLFFDADTFFEPAMLREVMRRALRPSRGKPLGLMGGCPAVEREGFLEHTFMPVIPIMFNLGPVQVSLRNRFMPPVPGFFHLWPRDAYRATGGYRAVWDKVLDDMEMCRVVLQHGFSLKLIDPSGWMGLRMYRSLPEIWNGLHKSVGYLMFKNLPLAMLSAGAILWAGCVPLLAPAVLAWRGTDALGLTAAASLALAMLFRLLDWARNGGRLWSVLLQPVLSTFLAAVLVHSTWSLASGRGVVWKDRRYDDGDYKRTYSSQARTAGLELPRS